MTPHKKKFLCIYAKYTTLTIPYNHQYQKLRITSFVDLKLNGKIELFI